MQQIDLAHPARLESLARTRLDAVADEAFERFCFLARRLLGASIALVSMVDDRRQFFPGMAGVYGELAQVRQTPLSHSLCQHVVRAGAAMVIPDTRIDALVCANPAVPEMGVVAYLGMPLTDDVGRVLGSLCVIENSPRDWSASDIDVLSDLAAAASSELRLRILLDRLTTAQAASDASREVAESARQDAEAAQRSAEVSRDQAQHANERLALLAQVGAALTATLDPEQAVGRLAPLLVPLLADFCIITVVEEDNRRHDLGYAHRDPQALPDLAAFAEWHGTVTALAPTSVALRTGAPVVLAHLDDALMDASVPQEAGRAALARLKADSCAVFPLRARGRTFGTVALINLADRVPHTPNELATASDIARRAGLALDNARLYDRQRRTAETLQLSLLSEPPEVEGLEIAVRYRPATVEAHVGGDWYDAFSQHSGGTVLVIGDVVGHDIVATATMGKLRGLVRGIAYDSDGGPAEVLAGVDRAIAGLEAGTLATSVVARLQRSAGGGRRLEWANAGHPPPFLVGPGGDVQALAEPSGIMLGVESDAIRRSGGLDLEPGSTLLLCTDGLFERRELDIDVSLRAVAAALADLAGHPLERLCDDLLTRLVPGDAHDDVALIAVRVQ